MSEKREPKWDFLWNVLGDDVRERGFLGESITEGARSSSQLRTLDEMDALTEAAIKVRAIAFIFTSRHEIMIIFR